MCSDTTAVASAEQGRGQWAGSGLQNVPRQVSGPQEPRPLTQLICTYLGRVTSRASPVWVDLIHARLYLSRGDGQLGQPHLYESTTRRWTPIPPAQGRPLYLLLAAFLVVAMLVPANTGHLIRALPGDLAGEALSTSTWRGLVGITAGGPRVSCLGKEARKVAMPGKCCSSSPSCFAG